MFREDLGANELLGNRSLWFEANIVRNECWSHQNIVLLGDALRTVHFVGLGHPHGHAGRDRAAPGAAATPGDARAAFAVFEAQRRPASSNFQAAAARSLDWYENVADKMHLDPVDFAYDYMRRTGQVSHDDLRQRDPAFASAYEARHR